MRRTHRRRYRFIKAGCLGAGLLSISNPTVLRAADIGMYDVHNDVTLAPIVNPFPSSLFGVNIAAGDLDDDGFADIVAGHGGGGGGGGTIGDLKIYYNPREIHKSSPILAHSVPPNFGINVATGDLDGDGRADIVVTPASGDASPMQALCCMKCCISGTADRLEATPLGETPALFPGAAGGVSVAIGDLDGDMMPDIVAATKGDHHIQKVWFHKNQIERSTLPLPLGPGEAGLEVAMGDVDGDGIDDIIASANETPDGSAHLYMAMSKALYEWIDNRPLNGRAGLHIAVGDVDGDGIAEIITGAPTGFAPEVTTYKVVEKATTGLKDVVKTQVRLAYSPNFLGGVNVAAGDVNGDGFADIITAPAAIPEPATLGSLLTGAAAWLIGKRRIRRPSGRTG